MTPYERVAECNRIIAETQDVLCEVALPDLLDTGMPPWDTAAIRLQLELQLDQTLTALLLLSSWNRYKREISDMGIEP